MDKNSNVRPVSSSVGVLENSNPMKTYAMICIMYVWKRMSPQNQVILRVGPLMTSTLLFMTSFCLIVRLRESLSIRRKDITEKTSFKCNKCSHKYRTKTQLKNHFNWFHNPSKC